jgi:hypothetical protein
MDRAASATASVRGKDELIFSMTFLQKRCAVPSAQTPWAGGYSLTAVVRLGNLEIPNVQLHI